ncbi:hypothetical protein B0H10DRAFT_642947 [Mycena sp. CBHHK59/15]|nr:hypothetical protein B0H10DRAFT_642947 [Mycena sp. CBHHK59/15]
MHANPTAQHTLSARAYRPRAANPHTFPAPASLGVTTPVPHPHQQHANSPAPAGALFVLHGWCLAFLAHAPAAPPPHWLAAGPGGPPRALLPAQRAPTSATFARAVDTSAPGSWAARSMSFCALAPWSLGCVSSTSNARATGGACVRGTHDRRFVALAASTCIRTEPVQRAWACAGARLHGAEAVGTEAARVTEHMHEGSGVAGGRRGAPPPPPAVLAIAPWRRARVATRYGRARIDRSTSRSRSPSIPSARTTRSSGASSWTTMTRSSRSSRSARTPWARAPASRLHVVTARSPRVILRRAARVRAGGRQLRAPATRASHAAEWLARVVPQLNPDQHDDGVWGRCHRGPGRSATRCAISAVGALRRPRGASRCRCRSSSTRAGTVQWR